MSRPSPSLRGSQPELDAAARAAGRLSEVSIAALIGDEDPRLLRAGTVGLAAAAAVAEVPGIGPDEIRAIRDYGNLLDAWAEERHREAHSWNIGERIVAGGFGPRERRMYVKIIKLLDAAQDEDDVAALMDIFSIIQGFVRYKARIALSPDIPDDEKQSAFYDLNIALRSMDDELTSTIQAVAKQTAVH